MRLWLDRSGRFSPLRSSVLALLFAPGLWLAWRLAAGQLGARPITELIHQTGLWAIRLLLISLAVTPLRQLLRWPQLIIIRRMIGVAAFAYAAAHLGAYATDQQFRLAVVAMEIVRRFYLTIGAAALLALLLLAATSTDGMMRRLGGRFWRRLHWLVYPAGIVAAVHFFLQSKLDVAEPFVMAGLLLWLLGYRLMPAAKERPLRLVGLVGALGLLAGLVTLGGEIAYYALAFHADPLRVLAACFSLQAGVRPGWIVLAIGLVITALAVARARPGLARPLVTRTT
jgi:methionine sulfoxide reductase heme-binding subunit